MKGVVSAHIRGVTTTGTPGAGAPSICCFLASGYDDPDVISTMDITNNPGNCIAGIQTYIGSKFPDEEEYYHNGHISQPFEFPPGHRKRICNFVNEGKQLYQTDHHSSSTKRRTANQDKPLAKRPKPVPKQPVIKILGKFIPAFAFASRRMP